MARNPRRKSNETEAPEEENDVTVTEEAVEAEAPTEEAVEAEAPTEEAVEEVEEVPADEILFQAIVAFSNDSDVSALQDAYRGIHVSTRGSAQGVAMKRAMTEASVDMEVLGKVLDAFNNLPTTTRSSRVKPKIDDTTLGAIRLTGMMKAFEGLRSELGDESFKAASGWFEGEVPEEHSNAVERVIDSVIKASNKGIRGGGGTRTTYSDKLADLVERGDLTPGQVLQGANDTEATVQEDGTILTAGESFDNPSAAAAAHRVKEDGTKTNTNGWDYWSTEDGTSIGDLRKS